MIYYFLCLVYFFVVSGVNSVHDEDSLNHSIKLLSENLAKWNELYLKSLEPRLVSTATSLANIDSNIKNLQERAHVWDTFQLHVSAWNDQLAILDRKVDIISKGQEKLIELEETKTSSLSNLEYKIDQALKKIISIEDTISRNSNCSKTLDISSEFRGLKKIEKKLDQLLLQQKVWIKVKGIDKKPRLVIKCNTPRILEEVLNDISSKVDIIFDRISGEDISEDSYEDSDYTDDTKIVSSNVSRLTRSLKALNEETLFEKIQRIENISLAILEIQKGNKEELTKYLTCSTFTNKNEENFYFSEPQKSGCEDLDNSYKSGVYVFGNAIKNRRFCEIRETEPWTVIQRRDNYSLLQNFNLSWNDYKKGFGDIDRDFWFGNDNISKLSREKFLVLRIELEDFKENHVWSEYSKFVVLPEENNYQIIIGQYRGNSSDSFSSHNGSFFSTFDKKNDQAPECCPCSVSFGAGWWFNSCFEANLNGLYYKKGDDNGYFGGIIWENWLGDYSLKKSLMMVKVSEKPKPDSTTPLPYYEDP